MDLTEHSSFIETAMKHHSTSQAAIKSLQHQLECFEQIRNSTKEIFNLTQENEKALERSAKSLVLSTSRHLVDPTSEQITPERHPLSSTLNKQDKVGDDSVIRNLLPSFEEIRRPGEPVVETYPFPITPIKSFSQSNIASATKDSLASGTLPPTPSSDAVPTSFATLNENSQSPSSKNFSVVAPSSGCMSLSEVLARLAYSSALNGTASGLDSTGNASDELIGLLEKISRTGEQLKMDLQDARLRESALIQEVRRLRGQQNGYRSNDEVKSPADGVTTPYSEVIRLKCEKLEDALLSLQDENVKLNRRLKGSEVGNSSMTEHLQKKLLETKEENQLLREQLEKIANQLKKMNHSNEMSPEKDVTSQQVEQSASSVFEHKRQIRELEAENKSMTSRLNELNLLLVEKDEKLQEFQDKIRAASDESRSSLSRCEDLEKKDVYKRKEVLLLCDKFEKLKKISKRLESELQEYKNKERSDVTRKWAVDDSLQKIAQENNKIRSKMNAELQMLTMDKVLLEKDYSLLKKRYETLLQRITNDNNAESLGNPSNNSNELTQSMTSRPRFMTSLGIREDGAITTGDSLARACRSATDVHGPMTSTQRHHHRRHTSPYELPKPRGDVIKQLLPESYEANTLKRESLGAKRALLLTPPRGSRSVERQSLGRGSEHKRLSPLDVRQLAKSAYTDEYIKNMDGIGRMLSLSDHSSKAHERSGGSLQRTDESATVVGRNHQRSRTEPSPISFASRGFTSVATSAAKGESPYSDDYPDSARWVAPACGSKVGERSRSLSPGKSILKNAAEDVRRDQSSLDLPSNSSLAEKSSSWISSRYPAVSPPVKFRDRTLRSSSAADVANRSSGVSERSLHLSDLPCDRAGVYEKFRNFDSQLPASTLPMDSDPPPVPRARHQVAAVARFLPPLGRAADTRQVRGERMQPVVAAKETRKPRDDDVTSTEQSSVSTVRDHVGRVEFLRQLQTNAGVRMPALMRDVTINDDVIVDDDDMDGEVRLGLSQKQQAYADKLVRKYTKTGGKKSRAK